MEPPPPPPLPGRPEDWIFSDLPDTTDREAQTEGVPYVTVSQPAQISETSMEFVISVMEQQLRKLLRPGRAR